MSSEAGCQWPDFAAKSAENLPLSVHAAEADAPQQRPNEGDLSVASVRLMNITDDYTTEEDVPIELIDRGDFVETHTRDGTPVVGEVDCRKLVQNRGAGEAQKTILEQLSGAASVQEQDLPLRG